MAWTRIHSANINGDRSGSTAFPITATNAFLETVIGLKTDGSPECSLQINNIDTNAEYLHRRNNANFTEFENFFAINIDLGISDLTFAVSYLDDFKSIFFSGGIQYVMTIGDTGTYPTSVLRVYMGFYNNFTPNGITDYMWHTGTGFSNFLPNTNYITPSPTVTGKISPSTYDSRDNTIITFWDEE